MCVVGEAILFHDSWVLYQEYAKDDDNVAKLRGLLEDVSSSSEPEVIAIRRHEDVVLRIMNLYP